MNNQTALHIITCFCCLLLITPLPAYTQQQKAFAPLSVEKGQLIYTSDSSGNRIPDFSYAGYMAAEKEIPDAPVRVVVPWKKGDATTLIQAALDYVAKLPADADGVKGAVLLEKGIYEVSAGLMLQYSGVVLRGSGMGKNGTVIFAKSKLRETVIRIAGKHDRNKQSPIAVSDAYVPVNAKQFTVADASTLKAGDNIIVQRPSTL